MIPPPPRSPLFPYTTLFRSRISSASPRITTSSCRSPFSLSNPRSEEHTSELQSHVNLVCRLLLEKKNEIPARGRGGLVRPLLPFAKEPLVAHVAELGLPVHDDPANRDSCFFFNDTATTEIYTLSLHDALPI